ncbi:nucleoside-diphosphate sugar epimerase [Christiangramia fulva]|uniref:Nucleoside-diphosphate sugar epimerase n=1 Tax=Christiangramia fulva TaxID=2126553 RepID=A0A2R3Z205_9FLAO|nr:NmrA/HSCARG family protein [Christiangramia fulva]AVR44300.1 nucleoside-diphosphate sugar epimerase [Christiangramia fulva]
MEKKKIIAVVGATGSQGSGLVHAILNDQNGEFRVRAITRNATSDKAKELEKLGAEIVEADVADEKSLIEAFQGAYGAYCVTFFWEHFSPEKEKAHAKNMAEAAKKADLKHVIWSTLEDTRKFIPLDDDRMPTLMEHYKVPHFDAKGESDKLFVNSGVPYTLLLTSFYWDNFINFGMGPQKDENGELAITLPLGDKKLPGIAAEDIGKAAYGIFKAGKTYQGKTVGIAGEKLTGQEMADKFSKVLGKKVKYNAIPASVYRSFDFPGADDLGNMFKFNADFAHEFGKVRDIEHTRKLNPDLMTFEDWLQKNKEKLK